MANNGDEALVFFLSNVLPCLGVSVKAKLEVHCRDLAGMSNEWQIVEEMADCCIRWPNLQLAE
eukprot:11027040-Ditylum_brightwellii.AAC.2